MKTVLEQYLKKSRIQKGITQAEVSKVLGLTSSQYISNFERGICPVSEDILPVLAKLYNFSLKKLVNLRVADYKRYLIKKVRLKNESKPGQQGKKRSAFHPVLSAKPKPSRRLDREEQGHIREGEGTLGGGNQP